MFISKWIFVDSVIDKAKLVPPGCERKRPLEVFCIFFTDCILTHQKAAISFVNAFFVVAKFCED